MLGLSPRLVWGLLLISVKVFAQDSVLFFYSRVVDTCEWGPSNFFRGSNLTVSGGVCAYIPSTNRLFSCMAGVSGCWTFYQVCKRGTNTPASDQILCGKSYGSQWCCDSSEACTTLGGQVNVCISSFGNPIQNLTAAEARQSLYSAIPSSQIGSTIPASIPTPFSTRRLGISASTTPASSPSLSSRSLSTPSSSSTTPSSTIPSSTFSTSPVNTVSDSTSRGNATGLSGGVIAGIIIGALAALALICGTIIFLALHKRRRADPSINYPALSSRYDPLHTPYAAMSPDPTYDNGDYPSYQQTLHELPTHRPTMELPGANTQLIQTTA